MPWPEGLEDQLSPEGRRAVLVHELAHLRRRDHWVGWLLLAGACVWWWHPLYRWLRRELGREAERACDAWVVATLPEARRAFAEALLEVCQRRSAPVAAPALGAPGPRRDLERRLVMVMREQVPCHVSWRAVVGLGALALLALPAWTVGQVAPAPAAVEQVEAEVPRVAATNAAGVRAPAGVLPAAKAKAPDEKDKKLRDMEAKLAHLLKEVQALRKAGLAPGKATQQELLSLWLDVDGAPPPKPLGLGRPAPQVEIVLMRTTYALPAGKAEALGKFLREHVKAAVLETRVEKDHLVVTTTPEVQRAVGQFILLLQGKRRPQARLRTATGGRPITGGREAPRPRQSRQGPPRRRADRLRLVHGPPREGPRRAALFPCALFPGHVFPLP